MLNPGIILAARYRVLSQIGRGGMGAVFLVEHVHTGDRTALKLLHGTAASDPESIERFKREARAPAKIQSENVVRVLDADTAPEIGGAPFLVMELLTGNDLQKVVAGRGALPPEEAIRILNQIARALDKAHSIGVIHRDLKPENLFLHQREDGTQVVKILDFGISKNMEVTATSSGRPELTRTGAVMGTPLYMAPEQALGRKELIGPATDIWALGLIALFLLTGEPYWQGHTVPDILSKVLGHAMYPPSSRWRALPPAIDAWLLRACARMPDQRFPSAGEEIAALADILRSVSIAQISAAPTMLPTTPQPYSAHMTPPHVTPPTMMTPYGVGGSTNEPLVHTSRPSEGVGVGVKIAVALGLLLAFFGVAAVVTVYVASRLTSSEASAPTATIPTPPPPTIAPVPTATQVVDVDASLPPLQVGATTAQSPSQLPAATAHTAPRISRAQCKNECSASCVDANDMQGCLMKCLKKCPAQ